jgi:hypothetical protein
MNYLIHATPVHPSLCLQYLILLFTFATITVFTLLLLLLFYYCHRYKTVVTDKPLRTSLFPGAAELTSHLLRLINILWLPLCRINKFGFYFPQRLLQSPIHMGHQWAKGTHVDLKVGIMAGCSTVSFPHTLFQRDVFLQMVVLYLWYLFDELIKNLSRTCK